MKKLVLSVVGGAALLLGAVTLAASGPAEVCWHSQHDAGYYMMTFATGDPEKDRGLRVLTEDYTTDEEQINHWQIPDDVLEHLTNGMFTMTMHTIYMAKSRPWIGRPLQITDFSCTEPVALLPPDVFGDVTCDSRITATDALTVLRWSTGAATAPLGCP
jgi:hypothetical protein